MIKLSNQDKLYWKKDKVAKGELIEYYAEIAPHILPYLKDRPLVMHRYPEGVEGEAFYQKEAGSHLPNFVKTVTIQHEKKKVSYILVQNVNTLLYVANLGSIELHPFNTSIKHLDRPDYLALDLDPEKISFDVVVDTANVIHEILEELAIPHFCKTSGATGLHIYIPMQGKYSIEQVRQFAYLIATIAHQKLPDTTSLERLPKKRQKKVYIDYLQNEKGQTMVCAYSVRGTTHPTVSTPLLWKEVKHSLDPQQFTIRNIPKRVSQKGDLFKGILGKGINLQTCLKKLENSFH